MFTKLTMWVLLAAIFIVSVTTTSEAPNPQTIDASSLKPPGDKPLPPPAGSAPPSPPVSAMTLPGVTAKGPLVVATSVTMVPSTTAAAAAAVRRKKRQAPAATTVAPTAAAAGATTTACNKNRGKRHAHAQE